MASSARRITVEFLGDAKGLDKTATQVEKKTTTLGSHMAKVGKIAAIGLAGGLVVAGKAMSDMVKNGADDLAAQRKLAVALHNTTGATKEQVKSVESWITKQGVALGVTDDDLRPALQRLVQATGSVSKAQKLAGIAMDASAGSGKSLKVVSEAISKAQNGNLGALSRLGVKIKDTHGKTLTFNEAMKEMGKTFKGQAAAGANTFDGKMGRLKLMFDETKETIGQALIPMLTKLADWFLKLVKGMQDGTGAGGDLRDAFSKVVDVVKDLAPKVEEVFNFLKNNKAAVATFIGVLAGFKILSSIRDAWLALNIAMSANPIGIVVVAIAALAAGLVYAYKHSETFRDIVNGVFGAVAKTAKWLWEKGIRPYFKFIIDLWLNVVGGIINGAAKAFGWVPGLGPKLKTAAAWFNGFKKDVNDQLNGIHDKKIKVTTPGADAAINNLKAIKGLIHDITTSLPKRGSKNATSLTQLLDGGRAAGGPVSAGGAYLVGERGPEILKMGSQSGSIVPNHRIAAGSGGGTTVNVHFHGLVTNPQAVAKEIEQIFVKYQRTSGRPLAFI